MAKNPRKTIKYTFLIVVTFLIGIAVIDSVGVFNKKDYVVVPHGNHNHYVPNDRDPDMPVHSFPQRPPNPGEKITPQGQIVRIP
jgi:hypothetical protein